MSLPHPIGGKDPTHFQMGTQASNKSGLILGPCICHTLYLPSPQTPRLLGPGCPLLRRTEQVKCIFQGLGALRFMNAESRT